jgi:two-component system, NtrC family, sensor histidine kinase PilS
VTRLDQERPPASIRGPKGAGTGLRRSRPVAPAGEPGEDGIRGRNLFLVRTGITFALLASAVFVHLREPELLLTDGFQFLYVAVVLSFGWLLLRYALWGTREPNLAMSVVQAATDAAFISIIVFATGLFESVFVFMYVIVIMLGSIEFFMMGALLWAGLASLSYTAMLYLQMTGVLVPPGGEGMVVGVMPFLRASLTNSAGFVMTGILAGILGEEYRKTRQRVQDREVDLQKLTTFHKDVVENIPSGIITADTLGRVNLMNGTACGILGVRREDVTGRLLEDVLAGLEPESSPRSDPRSLRPEITFRRADGSEIHLGFSASPLRDADGNVIGRVVIFQDLTPVKQMEERVRISDKLAMVGELAAGLAHEIRNPLASIAGSSQMLRESFDIPEESRPLLEIIERESTRLNGLISDFLAFSGPSLRNARPVNMADMVREIAEAVRLGEGREKGIEVETASLRDVSVTGDAEQLRQVVWNLVRNAVQATPPGGCVRLDLFSQIRHGERYAITTVSDTGKGIDPAVIGKIFNPFFTTKEGGTGLGLAISQRIIHFHRGVIEVRSHPGKGSTFSILIPERPAAAGAGSAPV